MTHEHLDRNNRRQRRPPRHRRRIVRGDCRRRRKLGRERHDVTGRQVRRILLVQLPADNVEAFFAGSRRSSHAACRSWRNSATKAADDSAREHSIEFVGQDRPGIVHEITEVLADFGINVKELETTVQSASMSGESLFMARRRSSSRTAPIWTSCRTSSKTWPTN